MITFILSLKSMVAVAAMPISPSIMAPIRSVLKRPHIRRVLLSRSVFMTEEETLGAEGYEGEYIVTPYFPGPTT